MINGGKIYANSLVLANSAYDFNWSTLDDDGHKPEDDADVTGTHTAKDIVNLPSVVGDAGLYANGTYLGYHDGTSWKAYIQNNGNFYFGGNSSNYIKWNGSTLNIKGTLDVSSLAAINSTLGSVNSGTISSSQIKFTTSSSYSAYFTNSGIYVYDGYSAHGAPSVTFYKSSSYKRFAILLGTSSSGVYSETKLVLTGGGTSVSIINGVLALPNLSSNPTGQYGGICMVSGQLKYYDGSNWVNA
jgi:hypothetical protein